MLFLVVLVGAGQVLPPGTASLPASASGELLVLSKISVTGATVAVARSYDGFAWEKTQGGVNMRHEFSAADLVCDDADACETSIPTTTDGSVYRVNLYSGRTLTSRQAAARLLMQATFGPTTASLQNVDSSSGSVRDWLSDQMQQPPSLHREYYRQRVNPRRTQSMGPLPSGSVRSACRAASRWHRFALTKSDEGSDLVIEQSSAGGGFTLRVDGSLRGEVASFDAPSFAVAPATYTICYVEERVGGHVRAQLGSGSNCKNYEGVINPPIDLSTLDLSVSHVLSAEGDAWLVPLQYVHNVSLLSADIDCTPKVQALDYAFLRDIDGAYFRHDPRLAILSNTLHGERPPWELFELRSRAHSLSPYPSLRVHGESSGSMLTWIVLVRHP